MIERDIYLNDIDWNVKLYMDYSPEYADEVVDDIVRINVSGHDLKSAKDNLWEGTVGDGMLLSDLENKKTVMVFGKAPTFFQYLCSIDQKTKILLDSISKHKKRIDADSRDKVCGQLLQEIFKDVLLLKETTKKKK